MVDAEREERRKTADKLSDPIEKDIWVRYGMKPEIWRKSNRTDFPYMFVPNDVMTIALTILVIPLVYLGFLISGHELYLKTIVLTIVTSVAAYFVSSSLIGAFKDKLCENGLFGRDLNKSGEQRYKLPVPEARGIVISIVLLITTIS